MAGQHASTLLPLDDSYLSSCGAVHYCLSLCSIHLAWNCRSSPTALFFSRAVKTVLWRFSRPTEVAKTLSYIGATTLTSIASRRQGSARNILRYSSLPLGNVLLLLQRVRDSATRSWWNTLLLTTPLSSPVKHKVLTCCCFCNILLGAFNLSMLLLLRRWWCCLSRNHDESITSSLLWQRCPRFFAGYRRLGTGMQPGLGLGASNTS